MDNFITDGIKLWEPPGMAVAVVKDGVPVFLESYGVTNLSTQAAVDNNTLFVCASTTKAFTAAALAILVDEGKVSWNDRVIDHLPTFRLKDPYLTRELTVKDLLTHRSGLGNTDYLWTVMSISSDSAVTRLIEHDLSYSPRASFIYQNLMYLTAGLVVEAASGMSWENFLKERIYSPLGMDNTYACLESVTEIQNKADGHYEIDGEIVPIQQLSADAIGPAGSMWSSITDMAKWMSFLNNEGIVNGDTVISSKNFNELFNPQQIVPLRQFYPSQELTEPNWRTYGLGWFQHDYKGKKVDFHTGSLPGMVAIAGLMRSENLGIYVFSNLDHVELRHAIMYAAFDIYGEGKLSRDWNGDLKKIYDERQDEDEEPVRIENTTASIPADSLSGRYFNDLYGEIEISKTTEKMLFSLNGVVTGTMEHWHYDTYEISFDRAWYGEGKISFRMDASAKLSYLDFWGLKFDRKEE